MRSCCMGCAVRELRRGRARSRGGWRHDRAVRGGCGAWPRVPIPVALEARARCINAPRGERLGATLQVDRRLRPGRRCRRYGELAGTLCGSGAPRWTPSHWSGATGARSDSAASAICFKEVDVIPAAPSTAAQAPCATSTPAQPSARDQLQRDPPRRLVTHRFPPRRRPRSLRHRTPGTANPAPYPKSSSNVA